MVRRKRSRSRKTVRELAYSGEREAAFRRSIVLGRHRLAEGKPVEGYSTLSSAYYSRASSMAAEAHKYKRESFTCEGGPILWLLGGIGYLLCWADALCGFSWALWYSRRTQHAAGGAGGLSANQLLVRGAILARVPARSYKIAAVDCFERVVRYHADKMASDNAYALACGALCELSIYLGRRSEARDWATRAQHAVEHADPHDHPRVYRAIVLFLRSDDCHEEAAKILCNARIAAVKRGDWDQVDKLDAMGA